MFFQFCLQTWENNALGVRTRRLSVHFFGRQDKNKNLNQNKNFGKSLVRKEIFITKCLSLWNVISKVVLRTSSKFMEQDTLATPLQTTNHEWRTIFKERFLFYKRSTWRLRLIFISMFENTTKRRKNSSSNGSLDPFDLGKGVLGSLSKFVKQSGRSPCEMPFGIEVIPGMAGGRSLFWICFKKIHTTP